MRASPRRLRRAAVGAVRSTASAGLLAGLLSGCAAPAPPAPLSALLHDELFAAPAVDIDARRLFEMSAAMRCYAEAELLDVARAGHDRRRALVDAFVQPQGGLRSGYDSSVTRTAAHFAQRVGNCLSLMIAAQPRRRGAGWRPARRQLRLGTCRVARRCALRRRGQHAGRRLPARRSSGRGRTGAAHRARAGGRQHERAGQPGGAAARAGPHAGRRAARGAPGRAAAGGAAVVPRARARGEFALAGELLQRESRHQPFQHEAHSLLARASAVLGERAAAERHLGLAAEYGPTLGLQALYAGKLRQLRAQGTHRRPRAQRKRVRAGRDAPPIA